MFRAVRLATLGVCALAASMTPAPAHAAGPDYTTWFFAEGSTSGVLGFEEELLLANPNPHPMLVKIEVFGQGGATIATVDDFRLEAHSRTGISVRSIPNVGDQAGVALRVSTTQGVPFIAERTMYWGGGFFRQSKANSAVVSDLRGGHNEKGANAASLKWYFAEGEGKFFNTFVSVANPSAQATRVNVAYLDDKGNQTVDSAIVDAHSRFTFWPTAVLSGKLVPGQAGFATIVESVADAGVGDGTAQPVVAERQMYWGPGAPFGIRGGHAAMGIPALSATWLFAEGVQGGALGYDTYLLLFNPQPATTTVTVQFFGNGGEKLHEVVRTIAPGARDNVPASEWSILDGKSFAIQVNASKPIIAERAIYWRGLTEGTATAGATAPARKWGFAEGLQGGFLMYQDAKDLDKRRFNTFFPIYNPNDAAATVTVHFYVEGDDAGITRQVTVPGKSRETVWTLTYEELANKKFAAFFDSTQPVVVERAVYWGANNKAGHASLGSPLPDDFVLSPAVNPPSGPTAGLTVTPNRGVPSGGTVVEIEGDGFGHTELGTQVLIGGKAATFEVENFNTIRAVVPPGTTGPADVTVITRGQTLALPGGFTYADPFAASGPAVAIGDLYGIVASVANARRFELHYSCTEHGSPNSNTFMFEVVAELRRRFQTNRWGLNWKRGNVGDLSQDIVNYFNGPEGSQMRNSTQVRIYDIIGGHCGGNPSPFWVDQTAATRNAGTVGRWTTDPMCRSARYRDAKFDNGEWMFPECR
jgi:hypothetical protein